jgi:hypothetical protein
MLESKEISMLSPKNGPRNIEWIGFVGIDFSTNSRTNVPCKKGLNFPIPMQSGCRFGRHGTDFVTATCGVAAGKETKTAQFSLGSDSPCSAIALQSSMSGWKIPDS